MRGPIGKMWLTRGGRASPVRRRGGAWEILRLDCRLQSSKVLPCPDREVRTAPTQDRASIIIDVSIITKAGICAHWVSLFSALRVVCAIARQLSAEPLDGVLRRRYLV